MPPPNLLAGAKAPDYVAFMDARTKRQQRLEDDHGDEASVLAEAIATKRDRLLASLTLIAGIGILVALPFALRAGAEFFMPVTAALVIAIALVPLLEWFERRGIPSKAAAGLCVMIFLLLAIFVIGIDRRSRQATGSRRCRTGSRKVRHALQPVFDLYKNLDRFVERIANQIEITHAGHVARRSRSSSQIRSSACSRPRRRTCLSSCSSRSW